MFGNAQPDVLGKLLRIDPLRFRLTTDFTQLKVPQQKSFFQ